MQQPIALYSPSRIVGTFFGWFRLASTLSAAPLASPTADSSVSASTLPLPSSQWVPTTQAGTTNDLRFTYPSRFQDAPLEVAPVGLTAPAACAPSGVYDD
jgi:hypothetical protein